MSTLYCAEQGATLHYRDGCFEVAGENGNAARIPPAEVDRVVCFGRVGWTPAAMAEMLNRGIAVSLHTQGGHCRGVVCPDAPPAGLLREAQWAAALDERARLELARPVVEAKTRAALALFDAYRKNRLAPRALRKQVAALGRRALAAKTHEALLGCEGAAARAYYTHLRALVPAPWVFESRKYRPAPDPVNALLSFSYGLACNQIAAECHALGLDIAAGFLHRPQRARASLPLDLLEPFRPLVCDHFVLRVTGLRMVQPEGFEPHDNGGVRMNTDTRRRVIAAWDAMAREEHAWLAGRSPNAAFREEAQRLARALRGEETPWRPVPWCG